MLGLLRNSKTSNIELVGHIAGLDLRALKLISDMFRAGKNAPVDMGRQLNHLMALLVRPDDRSAKLRTSPSLSGAGYWILVSIIEAGLRI